MTKKEFIDFHLSNGWSQNEEDEINKTTKLGAELYWKVDNKEANLYQLTTYQDGNEYFKLLQTVCLKDCSINDDNKLRLGDSTISHANPVI